MAQPPPSAGPAGPPAAPQAPPPPYPYPYPYPYYPPPRKDNTALIIVIVVIVVILVTVVLSAVLYVMVSGLLGGQPTIRPVLTFGAAQPTNGNVTFTVAAVSQAFPYSAFKVTLQVGGTVTGAARAIAAEPGYAIIGVSGTQYRIYWNDLGDEGNLNDGDSFRITGDGVPLTTGSYTFYLLWTADDAQIQTKSWLI